MRIQLIILLLCLYALSARVQGQLPTLQASLYQTYEESKEEDLYACCKGFCGDSLMATSYLPAKNELNYEINMLRDDNKNTAWVEGQQGNGIGEYFEFYYSFDDKYKDAAEGACFYTDEFFILNGYQKDSTTWQQNNRVKKLLMYLDDKPYCYIVLKNEMGIQSMKLNFIQFLQKKKSKVKIRFEIRGIYKGDKYADTAISELYW